MLVGYNFTNVFSKQLSEMQSWNLFCSLCSSLIHSPAEHLLSSKVNNLLTNQTAIPQFDGVEELASVPISCKE